MINHPEQTTSPELLAHWEEYEALGIRRGEEVAAKIRSFTDLEGKAVLDLGCGHGALAYAFAQQGCIVTGIDVDQSRLASAVKRFQDAPGLQADFLCTGGELMPFGSASFDVVVCNDVLEHVVSHRRTLIELSRVLKPGGWAYFKFPNLLSLRNLLSDPHYSVFGASVLPPKFGAWYVVKLLRRSGTYEVGRFPIASNIIRLLRGLRIEVVAWWPAPQRKIGVLTPILRWYRLNTHGEVIILARKVMIDG